MSENDPDPHIPAEQQPRPEFGGAPAPDAGDPTQGGKRGQIGDAPSVTADQPDDGSSFPVGGGNVREETDAPPVAEPGPDA